MNEAGGGMDNGDLSAKKIFGDIVRTHYARLLSFVRGIADSDAAAQDIVQETFISAYQSFGGYAERGKVFAWLKTIARNTAYRYTQKENRYVCLSLSGPLNDDEDDEINLAEGIASGVSPEDEIVADEGYQYLLSVIGRLPEHQREVVYYRFVEGMPVNEVALRLSLSPGTVKSKAHYGLAKVKSELKNYLIEGEHIMDCKKAYEYLYQYAKDAILAEDRAAVEKHLEVCNHCKDIAGSLKKLIPHIKPAPEGMMRHYNISFQVEDGMILCYSGITAHIHNFKQLNEMLASKNGVIPDEEVWFQSGFGSGVQHLAEFDNEGNRVGVKIYDSDVKNHMRIRYAKMKKVFEYHQMNSVFLNKDTYGEYIKSPDAPNLFIAKTKNNLGSPAKSGLYLAIPGKAKNVRLKQGVDVLDCGAYKFVYDDRYVTESQAVVAECTYNM